MNIKIGNTPLIKINYKYNDEKNNIFAKLEYFNLTGSIKDRVAYYIIKEAYKKNQLKKGMKIVEVTSGNTGIALSALGTFFGNPVRIYMPDWVSKERQNLIKMYNAEIILVSKKDGGFRRAIKDSIIFAEKNNAFLSNQFENYNNILAHYETTANEILLKLKNSIGGFVSGIGTGGTLMGISKRLKEYNKDIQIYALEPDKMPLLSQNKIYGDHKIEGIGDDFIPKIVDKNLIDKIFLINDDDAINMSRKLSQKLGLGVGISSGANLLASIIAKKENKKNIVTVFPDDNKKYISTDLSKPIDTNPNYLSNKIELIDYEFI